MPITVDQHGRVVDGNNRAAIAAELGIDCPRVVVEVADDDAAIDMALTLNCARRHLTQEQKRQLIRAELSRRADDSDRAIARRVGCSPSTVGAVRKDEEGVSNLDSRSPVTREEAEQVTGDLDAALTNARGALYWLVGHALTNHITVPEVIGALTMARLKNDQRGDRDPEVAKIWGELLFDYVIQVVSWGETAQQFPPHPDSDPTPEERAMLIDMIVGIGLPTGEHPADKKVPVG